MSFAWPHLLWLLAIPAGLLAWELSHRRRTRATAHPKILRAEAGPRSLKLSALSSQLSASQGRPRPWLYLGLIFAIVALARPQWGRLEEPVFDQSREILLAIDLSRSMLTPDVKPSRLDRSKLLIQSLLEKLQGERVGLVVFAGTAFLQSPLSADYEILREFLPALGPDFLPQGGSNYGALLDSAIQAFSATNTADRFLVILSDGEATDDDWKRHVEELKKKGVRVLGLGIGTAEGAMIPDGAGGLVKDERGAVVMSKLESATLQELARDTNGVYRDASTWVDLASLVRETIEAGQRGQFVEKNTVRLVERFQWPLALAVWFLFVSFYYEFPVRPRVRDLRLTAGNTGNRIPETGKKTAATVAALLLLVSGFRYPVSGFAAVKLANPSAASAPSAEPSSLAKIVGRIAGAENPTGRDWAELARETVTWGSRLQSGSQPVPEAPVRDALAAVDLGSKLDAKTADWPKLREELEALLEKKEDEKQDQQQQDQQQNQDEQQQQQKDQQKQDQQKQNKKQQDQKQDQQQKQQPDQSEKNEQNNDPSQKQDQKKEQGESAFGDMNKKEEPPPPPEPQPEENMQKVGGAEKQAEKEPADPALALPLQKLDQLRNQDSPAQLFQLMEGDKKPTKKATKDW